MFNSKYNSNDDEDDEGDGRLYDTSGLFGDDPSSTGSKVTRQRPNGRLTSPDYDAETDPPSVDRSPKGRFVSRDRDPEPVRRDTETGRLFRDRFAVGEFFDDDGEDGRWF